MKSGKDPCGACQTGLDSNAIFCGGYRHCVHKKYSGPWALTLISGVPDALGLLGVLMKEKMYTEVKVENEKLEGVPEFSYLG